MIKSVRRAISHHLTLTRFKLNYWPTCKGTNDSERRIEDKLF